MQIILSDITFIYLLFSMDIEFSVRQGKFLKTKVLIFNGLNIRILMASMNHTCSYRGSQLKKSRAIHGS